MQTMYDSKYFKDYKEQSFKWKFWARFLEKRTTKTDNILEIGCTYGFLFKYLKDYENKYGIDISEHAIKQARLLSQGANYQVMNAEKLKFEDTFFQAVLAIDVLEHVKNPSKAIKEISRVLKKDGLFIMVTPNIDARSRKERGKDWFAYKDQTHISILPKEQWVDLLRENDLEMIQIGTIDMFDIPYHEKLFKGLNFLSYVSSHPIRSSELGDNLCIIAEKH